MISIGYIAELTEQPFIEQLIQNVLMKEVKEYLNKENTEHTSFKNPHGLDDHEDHYSSAYDMALLTQYAMNNEKFRTVSSLIIAGRTISLQ